MRAAGVIPTHGGQLLREHQVRILWASWHMVTLMGWFAAGLLLWLASPVQAAPAGSLIAGAVMLTMLACAALVCVATKGRHPGWAALLATAVLTGLGM